MSRPSQARGWLGGGPSFYESVGAGYTRTRKADPRLEAAIHTALGDARTVVNVGAGAGAYEPRDREVVAVEPAAVMRAQRPTTAAPVIDAKAESLPFADGAFDASMAVLSDHHWADHERGIAELLRVARRRAVLFTWDPARVLDAWLIRDYLPTFADLIPAGARLRDTARAMGDAEIRVVPIPHDCRDGFLHAFWRRPHAYLDPEVQGGISVFARLDPAVVAEALERLRRDLHEGAWHGRNREILDLSELDLGYRLLIADLG